MASHELIIGRCCMFVHNDDNVVFAWISHMKNIACFKMGNGVLTFFVTQPDTDLFVLVTPCFHTEWLESDCYDPADHQQVMQLLCLCLQWLVDGLASFSL